MDVYEEMGELYDLVYSEDVDMDFYLMEARNAKGPVLEVACGTGRILLRLLQDGIEATGIDISEAMLRVLRDKAHQLGLEPDVHLGDMADFRLGRKFDLIIVPYRSFLHLDSESLRRKALENFKGHLNPGGRLILHAYNPSEDDLLMTGDFHHYEHQEGSWEGKSYSLDWFLRYEPREGRGSYRIRLSFDDGRVLEYPMSVYFVGIKEMRELLGDAGFKNIRLYCGFDYSPFYQDCTEALWIAEG